MKKLFTDGCSNALLHGRLHARQTKCDHKSSPCHYVTGELKMYRLYRKNDHLWSFFYTT